jgi:hypothetical protein
MTPLFWVLADRTYAKLVTRPLGFPNLSPDTDEHLISPAGNLQVPRRGSAFSQRFSGMSCSQHAEKQGILALKQVGLDFGW